MKLPEAIKNHTTMIMQPLIRILWIIVFIVNLIIYVFNNRSKGSTIKKNADSVVCVCVGGGINYLINIHAV